MYKKIILGLCMILLLQTVQAGGGFSAYVAGEYYEYLGLFDEAKQEYSNALSLFSAEGNVDWVEKAQDALNRVKNINEKKSEIVVVEPNDWKFIGELKSEESVTHYFHTKDSEFVMVSKIPTDLDIIEVYDLITKMKDEEYKALSDAGVNCRIGSAGEKDSIQGYVCEKDVVTLFKGYFYAPNEESIYMIYASFKKDNTSKFYGNLEDLKLKKEKTSWLKLGIGLPVILLAVLGVIVYFVVKKKPKKRSKKKRK